MQGQHRLPINLCENGENRVISAAHQLGVRRIGAARVGIEAATAAELARRVSIDQENQFDDHRRPTSNRETSVRPPSSTATPRPGPLTAIAPPSISRPEKG